MIYLHVGYPKTATTTIQQFLHSNPAYLRRQGYIYPQLAKARQDSPGVSENAHNGLAVEIRRGAPARLWKRLAALVEQDPQRHVVLSGEGFSGCDPAAVREALGDWEVVIVYYVREFSKIITSQYAHRTKIGFNTDDFDSFLDVTLTRPALDLTRQMARWAKVFGPKRIKIRALDDRCVFGGDVRLDFLDAIDIDRSAIDRSRVEMTPDANSALGWKTLEILRDLNRVMIEKALDGTESSRADEARRARSRREESPIFDFAAGLWKPASQIGQSMGFDDRGNYLTAEQFDRCNEAYDAQVDALNASGMQTNLVHASRTSFQPRTFLPTIDEIPPRQVAKFLRQLAPSVWATLISGNEGVDGNGDDEE